MLMSGRPTPPRRLLTWFSLSLALVMAVAVGLGLLEAGGAAAAAGVSGPACFFLGLVWVVLGWILSPSVETYVGPGAVRGIPIIWPSSAQPERNPPVLQDLARKLSSQTSLGIVSAALGFVLMLVGFTFYLSPLAGYVAGFAYLAAMAAVALYLFRPVGVPAPS